MTMILIRSLALSTAAACIVNGELNRTGINEVKALKLNKLMTTTTAPLALTGDQLHNVRAALEYLTLASTLGTDAAGPASNDAASKIALDHNGFFKNELKWRGCNHLDSGRDDTTAEERLGTQEAKDASQLLGLQDKIVAYMKKHEAVEERFWAMILYALQNKYLFEFDAKFNCQLQIWSDQKGETEKEKINVWTNDWDPIGVEQPELYNYIFDYGAIDKVDPKKLVFFNRKDHSYASHDIDNPDPKFTFAFNFFLEFYKDVREYKMVHELPRQKMALFWSFTHAKKKLIIKMAEHSLKLLQRSESVKALLERVDEEKVSVPSAASVNTPNRNPKSKGTSQDLIRNGKKKILSFLSTLAKPKGRAR